MTARFEGDAVNIIDAPQLHAPIEHWKEGPAKSFTVDDRQKTTILLAGLTLAHDTLIVAAMQGLGYRMQALDCPDNEALQYGREFGNRGQCNPTYFTVGNLVKHLCRLRDSGMSVAEINAKYLFLTAGACGPCRLGTYITEYRKALRDAGFEGFRVLLFQQQNGVQQATGKEVGLKLDAAWFLAVSRAVIIGDVLNAQGYRIRPFELKVGETDRVIAVARERLAQAMRTGKGLYRAMAWCRRRLARIAVDRSRVKPKVAVIGEFWAMTTEGDGNYRLQRFLEQQGAEVEVQKVTSWLLYLLWIAKRETSRRIDLPGEDGGRHGLRGVNVRKRMLLVKVADRALRARFHIIARIMGLSGIKLPNFDELADTSHAHYDSNLRGGEGFMEVGKLIHNVVHKKTTMTISVKPFGCMPSSGVSDGVQSLITERYPEALFLPIETTGDGAVNVHSRIQMVLTKAQKVAEEEFRAALEDTGSSAWDIVEKLQKHPAGQSLRASPHRTSTTAANAIFDLAG